MALYDRFRGYDDANNEVPKLPIWGAITTFAEILNGESTDAELIARFDLSTEEQAEFASIKIKALADIIEVNDALMSLGLDELTAAGIARSTIRDRFTHSMMRAEFGYDSRAEFNSGMGI